ncbi:SRPBCC family protein [Pseudobdellovibrio sp. HCB154]|uniref:SRPBCC family protein n=1 Tax=Pseudobdellovibrio sp. HCB154 TaxID=3386277 RepID=UPI003916E7CF
MIKKIFLGLVIAIVLFLGFVSTRESKFHYERSTVINAPAEKIYPYISNFKNGSAWNSFDQKDPNVKRNFIGNDGEVGAKMEFEGNQEAGAGYLEMLSLVPNAEAQMKLVMTKPMHAENLIIYKLTAEPTGSTRFTWAMSGDAGFIGKLINIFIDCEKMITDEFEKSFQNLKVVIEKQ